MAMPFNILESVLTRNCEVDFIKAYHNNNKSSQLCSINYE